MPQVEVVNKRKKARRKPLIMGISALVGVVVIAIVAIVFFTRPSINEVLAQADDYSLAKQPQKALDVLNSRKLTTFSSNDKYRLYMGIGSVYGNQGQYDQAIAAYTKAEAIKQGVEVDEALADAYAAKGNNKMAATYYEKVIALYKSMAPNAGGNYTDYYQSKLDKVNTQ